MIQKTSHCIIGVNNVKIIDDVPVSKRNTSNKTCFHGLKMASIVLCILGFVGNSYLTFQQYIGEQTLIIHDNEPNSKLLIPSFTLCGHEGFRKENSDVSDLEINNYISNTFSLNEIVYCIRDEYKSNFKVSNCTGEPLFKIDPEKPNKWKLTTTYSAWRGRCYTIEYLQKVSKN